MNKYSKEYFDDLMNYMLSLENTNDDYQTMCGNGIIHFINHHHLLLEFNDQKTVFNLYTTNDDSFAWRANNIDKFYSYYCNTDDNIMFTLHDTMGRFALKNKLEEELLVNEGEVTKITKI